MVTAVTKAVLRQFVRICQVQRADPFENFACSIASETIAESTNSRALKYALQRMLLIVT